jgi:hypothetical protein
VSDDHFDPAAPPGTERPAPAVATLLHGNAGTQADDRTIRRAITEKLAPHAGGDAEVGRLLLLSLGRILLSEARRGRPWDTLASDGQVQRVADWLRHAVHARQGWLLRVDTQGRPLKVMKLGSVAQALREAGKAAAFRMDPARDILPLEPDEELHADLGDGYRLVRLPSREALDREGEAMQHCLAQAVYGERLAVETSLILSMRDALNHPHATLEVASGMLIQLQGKNNKPLLPKYLDRLVPFIRSEGWIVAMKPSWMGHVVDARGHWHRIDDLPDGLAVHGDLDLTGTEIEELPRGLTVSGTLYVDDSKLRRLPAGLFVARGIFMRKSAVAGLPPGFVCRGTLDLNDSNIATLPEGMVVWGNLRARGTDLRRLPENLRVEGTLDLEDSAVETVPATLRVAGDLDLTNTKVTTLPNGITVGGKLFLRSTDIARLPRSLKPESVVYHDFGTMTVAQFRSLLSDPDKE